MPVTPHDSDWPAVAVVGAGAVGCYFGGMLARAGAPVTLIGRPLHMDAIARDGLLLERFGAQERIAVKTSTEIQSVEQSRIVLFCVKTVDTETVAHDIQPHLTPENDVISMQNGIDNVERIRSAAGIRALPAVVYVGAAMAGPGHVKHSGRGDLVIGRDPDHAAALAALFARAEIPCRISDNIQADLWTKMVMNCAYNAISALGQSRYGAMVRSAPTRELMNQIVREAVAVARTEGVALSESDLIDAALKLGEAMTGAKSSTAQDINRGRPTEIDSLNGYLVRQGRKFSIPTPVNDTLYTLVKLLEESVQAAG